MSEENLEEMGPVDWVILGWEGDRPDGTTAAPLIVKAHEAGIIRILDIAFISKGQDGSVEAIDLDTLGPDSPFAAFAGASIGLMDHTDLDDGAEALDPGTSAAIIIWENRWAAPIATALRQSGGQLLDSGRVPVQALIASLDALESATA